MKQGRQDLFFPAGRMRRCESFHFMQLLRTDRWIRVESRAVAPGACVTPLGCGCLAAWHVILTCLQQHSHRRCIALPISSKSTDNMTSAILSLPEELRYNIVHFLEGEDLRSLRLTCKQFHTAATEALFSFVRLYPSEESIDRYNKILEHAQVSRLVRHVELNTLKKDEVFSSIARTEQYAKIYIG